MEIDDSRLPDRLPPDVEYVLTTMFKDFDKLLLLREFTDGFSDSRVFEVRPIKDRAQLPSVVKIDEATAIEQEWKAYKQYIEHYLSDTASIREGQCFPTGSYLGGLWYSRAGGGSRDVISLANRLRTTSEEQTEKILKRMLSSLDKIWNQKAVSPNFHFLSAYDSSLPANLEIKVNTQSSGTFLSPKSPNRTSLKVGDTVQVLGFRIVEISQKQRRITLDTPNSPSFRVYLQSVPELKQYNVGQIIDDPIYGEVIQTRKAYLEKIVHEIVRHTKLRVADSFLLDSGTELPNPLVKLPMLLNNSFDVNVSTVHGDLHLKNILIEEQGESSYFIDFAKARQDHVLRDLIQLEMSVLAEFVVPYLANANSLPEALYNFYLQLHYALIENTHDEITNHLIKPFTIISILRRAARKYFLDGSNWNEYYIGLTICLLGALRHKKLSVEGQQTFFWGASSILKLLYDHPETVPGNNLDELEKKADQLEESGKSNEAILLYHDIRGKVSLTNPGNMLRYARLSRKIGRSQRNQGLFDLAVESYELGLKTLRKREPGHTKGVATSMALEKKLELSNILTERAIVNIETGNLENALKDLNAASRHSKKDTGHTLLALAVAYRVQGNGEMFNKLVIKAKHVFAENQDQVGIIKATGNQTIDALLRGRPSVAVQFAQELLRANPPDMSIVAVTYLNLSIAYTDLDDFTHAREYAHKGVAAFGEDQVGILMCYAALAEAIKEEFLYSSRRGENERANTLLDEVHKTVYTAFGLAETAMLPEITEQIDATKCDLLRILGEAYIYSDNCTKAEDVLAEAELLVDKHITDFEEGIPETVTRLQVVRAKYIAECKGDLAGATDLLKSARKKISKALLERDLVPLDIYLAHLLIKTSELAQARVVLEEALKEINKGKCVNRRKQVVELLYQIEQPTKV